MIHLASSSVLIIRVIYLKKQLRFDYTSDLLNKQLHIDYTSDLLNKQLRIDYTSELHKWLTSHFVATLKK